jgi:putative transposase
VLRHLEIAESTWNRWRAQYGGMKGDEVRRLKELERENGRLKKIVADQPSTSTCSRSWPRTLLLTPERRRRAVARLQDAFGVSERRACAVVGQHRSTQRLCPRPAPADDAKLRSRLRQIARRHTRWGWRMAHALLLREGWVINKKRTRRVWREEGLRRPPSCRKHRRLSLDQAERLRGEYPNHVWALDFQFDETADQRRLKLLNILDEATREALVMRVGRTCTADTVVDVIEALVAERGAPAHLRMDNGPEMIAWALRDWCRMSGTGTIYIEPGSPWENPWVESFNGRVRDECLNVEEFGTMFEAQVVVEAWRIEYNTFRPHSALGYLTPAEYAAKWHREH